MRFLQAKMFSFRSTFQSHFLFCLNLLKIIQPINYLIQTWSCSFPLSLSFPLSNLLYQHPLSPFHSTNRCWRNSPSYPIPTQSSQGTHQQTSQTNQLFHSAFPWWCSYNPKCFLFDQQFNSFSCLFESSNMNQPSNITFNKPRGKAVFVKSSPQQEKTSRQA